mmetsp:Transcript_172757/g.553795  ORF Transcript_172757/g.553795 Transcript_172757/m.553795 type:complete len:267 (-) Transcript_172757:1196-1996(-)
MQQPGAPQKHAEFSPQLLVDAAAITRSFVLIARRVQLRDPVVIQHLAPPTMRRFRRQLCEQWRRRLNCARRTLSDFVRPLSQAPEEQCDVAGQQPDRQQVRFGGSFQGIHSVVAVANEVAGIPREADVEQKLLHTRLILMLLLPHGRPIDLHGGLRPERAAWGSGPRSSFRRKVPRSVVGVLGGRKTPARAATPRRKSSGSTRSSRISASSPSATRALRAPPPTHAESALVKVRTLGRSWAARSSVIFSKAMSSALPLDQAFRTLL